MILVGYADTERDSYNPNTRCLVILAGISCDLNEGGIALLGPRNQRKLGRRRAWLSYSNSGWIFGDEVVN